MNNGKLVISLDFELMWGVRDKRTVADYGSNIQTVWAVLPKMLDLLDRYKMRATFSTVGLLFFENKAEMLANLPAVKPQYADKNLSPYEGYFDTLENSPSDLYHFAPDLIRKIQAYPEQEVGTHTFSHYYCLERGQSVNEFRADIQQAKAVAEKFGIPLTSLVFPRNQFNDNYLNVCNEFGIICIRGNELSWLYEARSGEDESLIRRAQRLMDAYINISGHNCYDDELLKKKLPVNIPSSRFLRPFSKTLSFLDGLRLKRITSGMDYAAKNNLTYHLWWHPHNFGANQSENMAFLEKIAQHYARLNKDYNFQSHTMTSLAKTLLA